MDITASQYGYLILRLGDILHNITLTGENCKDRQMCLPTKIFLFTKQWIKKLLQLKFYENTGFLEEEPTNVDRVLPVFQRLRHYQGVDVRSVLPVLIMLQRFD